MHSSHHASVCMWNMSGNTRYLNQRGWVVYSSCCVWEFRLFVNIWFCVSRGFFFENFNIDNSYPLGKSNVSNSIGVKAWILPNTLVIVLFLIWTFEVERVGQGECSRCRRTEKDTVQCGEVWRWTMFNKENVGGGEGSNFLPRQNSSHYNVNFVKQ